MRAFLRILFVIPIGFMVAISVAVAVYLAAFGFREQDLWAGRRAICRSSWRR